MIARKLNLLNLLEKKSHFLFGARGTGKSFLIQKQLDGQAEIISLLDSDIYLQLQQTPSGLREIVEASSFEWIVIDEIQRIPQLLNEVHLLLEKGNKKFLLTGSSARRLKRENANMLGGRARKAALFPFCLEEVLNEKIFNLNKFLTFGALPRVFLSDSPYAELRDYLDTFLTDEIKTEAGVRNLPAFSRFLKIAGLSNGQQINFSDLAKDAQIHPNTLREYFQILVDTLLVFSLPPWQEGQKRKPVATSKFFFVDCGLANSACGIRELVEGTSRYATCFEQAVAIELNCYLHYKGRDDSLTYWRTNTGMEVDLVVGCHTGIEVKSGISTDRGDHKNLLRLSEEGNFKNLIVVNRSPKLKLIDGVRHMPIQDFVKKLWADEIF